MLKTFLTAITCCTFLFCAAQSKHARLVVRGDDMGYSHSGNVALIRSSIEGIQTSIEIIVPSPWFPEAVKMLKENPGIDVGIHLALTSEWDNVKWRPLTDCKTLKDSNGYFYPMVYPNKDYAGQSIVENKPSLKDIEMELRAQIELAKKHIPRISHLSAHMGCHNISPEVRALVNQLSMEYGFLTEKDLQNVSYIGFGEPAKSLDYKKRRFFAQLDKMEPGKTYIFVEHPGLDNEELRAIHHIGYEDVASDRQGVTDLFTDKEVRKKIKDKNILLVSYKDLKK